jgi:uncharacterized protein (DUF1800 family)
MAIRESTIDPREAWRPFEPSSKQSWNNRLAAHLLRRTGFGGTISEIVEAQKAGHQAAIARVFDQTNDESLEEEMKSAARLITGGSDASQLASWWLLRMIKTPCPFLEKMTLFWHGHFATGADKVRNARAMFRQNQLIRKHALGKFGPFVKNMSSDVAMLVYLDSEENRKTRPNENYARELLELFCLGPGNYSEEDIKEIARCFTGWEIRRGKFHFNEYQHDKKTKSFLGASGNFDGNDAVEIVMKQDAASRFIARKLVRFFVFDDADISDKLVAPVAKHLRESEFDIRSTTRIILSSGKKIKSPVELAVGFLRFFDASTNVTQLGNRIAGLGQRPLYPPNVKGWPGGRTWINASTVLARANLISDILKNDKTKFKTGSLQAWLKVHEDFKPKESYDWAEEFLLATPLSEETRKGFSALAKSADPIKSLAMLASLPEFQLN